MHPADARQQDKLHAVAFSSLFVTLESIVALSLIKGRTLFVGKSVYVCVCPLFISDMSLENVIR